MTGVTGSNLAYVKRKVREMEAARAEAEGHLAYVKGVEKNIREVVAKIRKEEAEHDELLEKRRQRRLNKKWWQL